LQPVLPPRQQPLLLQGELQPPPWASDGPLPSAGDQLALSPLRTDPCWDCAPCQRDKVKDLHFQQGVVRYPSRNDL